MQVGAGRCYHQTPFMILLSVELNQGCCQTKRKILNIKKRVVVMEGNRELQQVLKMKLFFTEAVCNLCHHRSSSNT